MRILMCGSRDLEDSSYIRNTLRAIEERHGLETTIVHGGAKGADSICGYYADKMGFDVEAHPANWDKFHRAAGPIRNKEMLDSGVDMVYAFTSKPLEETKGTLNMVTIAKKAGVQVCVTRCE